MRLSPVMRSTPYGSTAMREPYASAMKPVSPLSFSLNGTLASRALAALTSSTTSMATRSARRGRETRAELTHLCGCVGGAEPRWVLSPSV